jgi:2'-5' RNA ligase
VSLFHALPGEQLPAVRADLDAACRRPPFDVEVTGVRSLGRGAALTLSSPPLLALRAELAGRWAGWLTRQDRQRFAGHVTVQNKVDPARARTLVEQLSSAFTPWRLTATGVHVWRYLGGPWEHVGTTWFAAPD